MTTHSIGNAKLSFLVNVSFVTGISGAIRQTVTTRFKTKTEQTKRTQKKLQLFGKIKMYVTQYVPVCALKIASRSDWLGGSQGRGLGRRRPPRLGVQGIVSANHTGRLEQAPRAARYTVHNLKTTREHYCKKKHSLLIRL